MIQLPISLKAAPMQFAEFKPATYTPQEPNLEILNRSMEKVHGMMIQDRAAKDAFIASTNELRDKLNPAEWAAFDARVDDIRKRADEQTRLGNYTSALLTAADGGRDIAGDKDLQNRIATQKSWDEQHTRMLTGNYTSYTKRRYEDINRYRYDGTGTYTPTFNPVADTSLDDIWKSAVAQTPVRSGGNSTSTSRTTHNFITNKGALTDNPIEQTASDIATRNPIYGVKQGVLGELSTTRTSTSSGIRTDEKKAEDIEAIFKDMLNDSNIQASLRQNYETMIWLKNHAQAVLDNPDATEADKAQARTDLNTATEVLQTPDGFLYTDEKDFKTWLDKQSQSYFKHSAYKHVTTSSSSDINTGYNETTFGALNKANQDANVNKYSPSGATVEGSSVTIDATYIPPSYSAEGTADLF